MDTVAGRHDGVIDACCEVIPTTRSADIHPLRNTYACGESPWGPLFPRPACHAPSQLSCVCTPQGWFLCGWKLASLDRLPSVPSPYLLQRQLQFFGEDLSIWVHESRR